MLELLEMEGDVRRGDLDLLGQGAGSHALRTGNNEQAHDLQAGALTAVLTDYRFFGTKLYGVYRHRRYLSPKVRSFLDFIADDARLK